MHRERIQDRDRQPGKGSRHLREGGAENHQTTRSCSTLRAREIIAGTLLAHTTPLTWEHIGPSWDFLWENAAAAITTRRPLNLGRARQAARCDGVQSREHIALEAGGGFGVKVAVRWQDRRFQCISLANRPLCMPAQAAPVQHSGR